MSLRPPHWLEMLEYVVLVLAAISLVIALASGELIFPSFALLAALGFNLVNRLRLEKRLKRRVSGVLHQMHRDMVQQLQAFFEEQRLPRPLPPPPEPDLDQPLQAYLESLEESISGVVQYINHQALGDRIHFLEQENAQLKADFQVLRRSLQEKMTTELPIPSAVPPTLAGNWSLVWSEYQWNLLYRFVTHEGGLVALHLSPDGRLLATLGGDRLLKIWSLANGQWLAEAPAGDLALHRVLFLGLPAGGYGLVTGGEEETLRLWHLSPREEGQYQLRQEKILGEHQAPVFALAGDPEGKGFLSGGYDQTLIYWQWPQGHHLWQGEGEDQGIQSLFWWAGDGEDSPSWWAVGGTEGQVSLWRSQEKHPCAQWTLSGGAVLCLAGSHQGHLLVAGLADGSLWYWTLNDTIAQTSPAQPQRLAAHQGEVRGLAFSPDGEFLFSGGQDGQVKIWRCDRGQIRGDGTVAGPDGHTPRGEAVCNLALSPDGELLVVGFAGGQIQVWLRA